MQIVGALCVGAAIVSAAFGVWALSRPRTPRTADPARLVSRAVAPTRLAAAVMLAAGGAVALAGPPRGAVPVLVICVVGAVGTLAAGSWQGARYARYALRGPGPSGCGGDCACARSSASSGSSGSSGSGVL